MSEESLHDSLMIDSNNMIEPPKLKNKNSIRASSSKMGNHMYLHCTLQSCGDKKSLHRAFILKQKTAPSTHFRALPGRKMKARAYILHYKKEINRDR